MSRFVSLVILSGVEFRRDLLLVDNSLLLKRVFGALFSGLGDLLFSRHTQAPGGQVRGCFALLGEFETLFLASFACPT